MPDWSPSCLIHRPVCLPADDQDDILQTRYEYFGCSSYQSRAYRGKRSGTKVKSKEISKCLKIESIVTLRRPKRKFAYGNYAAVNKNILEIEIPLQCSTSSISVSKTLLVAVINTRSLNKNGFKLKDCIVEADYDLIAVTESWLPTDEILSNHIIRTSCPSEYKMMHQPRSADHRGGGVAIMYKKALSVKSSSLPDDLKFTTFEYMQRLIKLDTRWLRLIVVYRPPPSSANKLTVSQFMTEFTTFLVRSIELPGEVVIMGDFNFHIDDASDNYATAFLELLDAFNLSQRITIPTHRSGHILDLVITGQEQGNLGIDNILVRPAWISDHCLVEFTLAASKPAVQEMKTVTVRNWKSVSIDQFMKDINSSSLFTLDQSVTESVRIYNSTLFDLANRHAPTCVKTISCRPRAPWFTSELGKEKRIKRKLERRYRRTGALTDAERFKEQCRLYCSLLSSTREVLYRDKIHDNAGGQKELSLVIDKLLHRQSERLLPVYDDLSELTNRFSNYFIDKINDTRSNLDCGKIQNQIPKPVNTSSVVCRLERFSPVSEEEIKVIIQKTNNKSCSLDPVPTWLLKRCLSSFLTPITHIVNRSLVSVMPEGFKEAILTPVLKKSNLDTEVLGSYRPISNLSYVSKLIEKVVAVQITDYMNANQLEETMQSAYKKHHSTETALLRIHNDILWALDSSQAVLFVSLDLSAAFDTIDHGILLGRLESRLGITGNCLNWIKSYLEGRSLRVVIDGTKSELKDLVFGVPQRSVLGPKLFTMYILPLGDIARKHDVNIHLYADDCQLYITFTKGNSSMVKAQMECLLADIRQWMSANKLKLNDDKTEIMAIAGPRYSLDRSQLSHLMVGRESVVLTNSVRILGCDLDNTMVLKEHIKYIAKTCLFKLKNMFKVRRCINEEAAKIVVNTMITSKLDYCNGILYGLPASSLNHLYAVQKSSARFITYTGKYDHITSVMKALHWLPIRARIDYKILVTVHKSLYGFSPLYLTELLQKRPSKGTRADGNNDLIIPRFKRSTFGGRTFKYAGPKLWNALPRDSKNITDLKQF